MGKLFLLKIKFFLKDLFFGWGFLILFLINLASWLLLFLGIKPSDKPYILHFTNYLGTDWLGSYFLLFLLPFLGLIFLIINFLMAVFFYYNKKVLSYFLLLSGGVLEILILIQSYVLFLING